MELAALLITEHPSLRRSLQSQRYFLDLLNECKVPLANPQQELLINPFEM